MQQRRKCAAPDDREKNFWSSAQLGPRGVGAEQAGFDFSLHMTRLCADMAARVPQLGHIDMSRVAVGFAQTRKSTLSGVHACLVPLRFAGGAREITRRGQRWTLPPWYTAEGQELLYVLIFYLPRFLNAPLREKLRTVVHELWHIGPRFDGDLRRYRGRCYAHGRSQAAFGAQVERLLADWLGAAPPAALYDFLRLDFRQLLARYGKVFGNRIRRPQPIPIDDQAAFAPASATAGQGKRPP